MSQTEFMPAPISQILAERGGVPAELAYDYRLLLAFVLGVLAAWIALAAYRSIKARAPAAKADRPDDTVPLDSAGKTGAAECLGPAISAAVRSGNLQLHYQPKLVCRTMQLCGVEALSRWTLADGTLIPADEFVARAEAGGGITELTVWGVEQALRDSSRLSLERLGGPIFINLSGKLITAPFVARLIDMIGDNTDRIGFEITETAVLANPEEALGCLHTLRESGFELAIDDYGAGLSSLGYLKQIPATELKIDKQFIQGITRSNRDPLIVRSTIDLCHGLGMKVTAEGVEDVMTASLLRVMGCDVMQGYFVSKAVSMHDLIQFVDDHEGTAPLVPQIRKSAKNAEPE